MNAAQGQVIAVLSGGDWADADVEHIVTLKDFDTETVWLDYRIWFREDNSMEYNTFAEWSVKEGYAREATDDDVIVTDGVGRR